MIDDIYLTMEESCQRLLNTFIHRICLETNELTATLSESFFIAIRQDCVLNHTEFVIVYSHTVFEKSHFISTT